MANLKKVVVFDNSGRFDRFDPPENASAFIAWFQEKVDAIPEEFRDSAVIDLSSESYYDSSSVEVEIYYHRPETVEEENDRLKVEEERIAKQKARELKTLAELQAKYGTSKLIEP